MAQAPQNKSAPEIQAFILSLTGLHEQAHRLGMHDTGHKLHAAVQAAGWEAADIIARNDRRTGPRHCSGHEWATDPVSGLIDLCIKCGEGRA